MNNPRKNLPHAMGVSGTRRLARFECAGVCVRVCASAHGRVRARARARAKGVSGMRRGQEL